MLRPYTSRHPCCPQHRTRIRPAHHGPHRSESRDPPVVKRRGAAHHDCLEPRAAPRQPPHEAAQLGFALRGHGAGIHDGNVRGGGIFHDDRALVSERLAHQVGVVLVRLAAEGMEVNVHGRTVRPRRNVQTRSESPPPLRSRCSSPTSTSARPRANARPVPAAKPSSVGAAAPAPNGSCPPRAPSRSGENPLPTSRPADQLSVLNAPAPAVAHVRHVSAPASRRGENPLPSSRPADQLSVLNAPAPAVAHVRRVSAPASRTFGLGRPRRPPPTVLGRSVCVVTTSPRRARSR